MVNKSILMLVKNNLNLAYDGDDAFDDNILSEIRNQLATLSQLTNLDNLALVNLDVDTTYNDIIGGIPDDVDKNELILLLSEYINLGVKIMFDTPNGSVMNIVQNKLSTLEWRIVLNLERSDIYNDIRNPKK